MNVSSRGASLGHTSVIQRKSSWLTKNNSLAKIFALSKYESSKIYFQPRKFLVGVCAACLSMYFAWFVASHAAFQLLQQQRNLVYSSMMWMENAKKIHIAFELQHLALMTIALSVFVVIYFGIRRLAGYTIIIVAAFTNVASWYAYSTSARAGLMYAAAVLLGIGVIFGPTRRSLVRHAVSLGVAWLMMQASRGITYYSPGKFFALLPLLIAVLLMSSVSLLQENFVNPIRVRSKNLLK